MMGTCKYTECIELHNKGSVFCIPHQMLLGYSNQGGWDRNDTWETINTCMVSAGKPEGKRKTLKGH